MKKGGTPYYTEFSSHTLTYTKRAIATNKVDRTIALSFWEREIYLLLIRI